MRCPPFSGGRGKRTNCWAVATSNARRGHFRTNCRLSLGEESESCKTVEVKKDQSPSGRSEKVLEHDNRDILTSGEECSRTVEERRKNPGLNNEITGPLAGSGETFFDERADCRLRLKKDLGAGGEGI